MEIKTVSEGTGEATADNGDEVTVSYVGRCTTHLSLSRHYDSSRIGWLVGVPRTLPVARP